ncbi:MAG: hypothetical protein MUO40_13160 [Anaerolineaceae bacterium]|nr:hypothetical protein [Anaerolineaceae bacterium]
MKKHTKMILIGLGLIMVLSLSAFTVANVASAENVPETEVNSPEIGPDHLQTLADELGITLDDLKAAIVSAEKAFIQAKVDSGDLAPNRVDDLLERLDETNKPFRPMRDGKPMGMSDEMNTYLAKALGISLEDLTQAQENVFIAGIAQAVADGKLTQEQADLMLARRATQSYMEEARIAAYQNAIAQALADGAITQAQADLLLANMENGKPGTPPRQFKGDPRRGGGR